MAKKVPSENVKDKIGKLLIFFKITTALHRRAFGYFVDDDIRFFDKSSGRAFDGIDDRFLQSVDALCKRSARCGLGVRRDVDRDREFVAAVVRRNRNLFDDDGSVAA